LTSVASNLDEITGRLKRGEGTAGKLLTEDALYARINSLSERIDLLVTRLNQGEGTAGRLLQDKQLYENMNGAAGELRMLIGEIRKDPKKYLNVKVSLF
jgi:phospholipid/cholesterol/gamma-HCH transport system substrate-binding protein